MFESHRGRQLDKSHSARLHQLPDNLSVAADKTKPPPKAGVPKTQRECDLVSTPVSFFPHKPIITQAIGTVTVWVDSIGVGSPCLGLWFSMPARQVINPVLSGHPQEGRQELPNNAFEYGVSPTAPKQKN